MADIKEIDYDEIIATATMIANSANNMQNAIQEGFRKIGAMSQNWYGNSYDNFVDVVNMSINGLNKLFETTVSDIPHEIAAKAKSYAASNQASVNRSLVEQTALMLAEVEKTNKGSKLRFKSTEVSADQEAIKSKFEDAMSDAGKASDSAESLTEVWKSISGDTNIQELKDAFARVMIILSQLSGALDRQISSQKNTIDALEGAANAVSAAKDVVSDAVDNAVDFGANVINNIQESASEVWTNLTGKN